MHDCSHKTRSWGTTPTSTESSPVGLQHEVQPGYYLKGKSNAWHWESEVWKFRCQLLRRYWRDNWCRLCACVTPSVCHLWRWGLLYNFTSWVLVNTIAAATASRVSKRAPRSWGCCWLPRWTYGLWPAFSTGFRVIYFILTRGLLFAKCCVFEYVPSLRKPGCRSEMWRATDLSCVPSKRCLLTPWSQLNLIGSEWMHTVFTN